MCIEAAELRAYTASALADAFDDDEFEARFGTVPLSRLIDALDIVNTALMDPDPGTSAEIRYSSSEATASLTVVRPITIEPHDSGHMLIALAVDGYLRLYVDDWRSSVFVSEDNIGSAWRIMTIYADNDADCCQRKHSLRIVLEFTEPAAIRCARAIRRP